MKKLLSLILVFSLVFALSVNSFAGCDFTLSKYDSMPFISSDSDAGFTKIGTFKTSLLTEDQKDFMREWFSIISSDSSTSFAYCWFRFFPSTQSCDCIFSLSSSRLYPVHNFNSSTKIDNLYLSPSSSSQTRFVVFNAPYDSSYFSPSGNVVYSTTGSLSLSPVDYNSDFHVSSSGAKSYLCNPYKYNCSSVICTNDSQFSSPTYREFTLNSTIYSVYNIDFFRSRFNPSVLAFIDDDGLLSEPEPDPVPDNPGGDSSESSGGSDGGGGTSEDTDNKGSITLPNIDNNAFVPYDLNAWNVVLDSTMPTLRKVFSIGFPLFLIFLGVQIMLGLIRKFALSWLGGGRHGGGGNIKHD